MQFRVSNRMQRVFVLAVLLLVADANLFRRSNGTDDVAGNDLFRAACVKVDNGAEGNVAPLHSVGDDINSPLLKEYQTLLGDRILAANGSLTETTVDVSLAIGKTVIETPRRAGLGWLDKLADYAAVSADGTNQVLVPVYSLTINRDTVIWAAPLELFSEIAINIRHASPFANTFFFGLTNGSLLYLPTRAAFSEGGYEPNVSPFTDQAEADLTSAVTCYLQELARSSTDSARR